MITQIFARVVFTLADTFLAIAVPGARLVDNLVFDSKLDDLAFARNAFAIENVEVGLLERRRHLVLHNLGARFRTDDLFALLDSASAADVDTHRGIELKRIAAGGSFRVAEHDTDLHTDLINEDDRSV